MDESARIVKQNNYFVWEPPARDIAILLNLDLVERLQALLRGSPDQEIGGVLWGHCDNEGRTPGRRLVVVDNIEAIPSEHLRGPAYSISKHDLKVLTGVLARANSSPGMTAVGFFRSHLRKGLYLDEADFSLFQAHFSSPCDVFLAIRPEPGGAPVAGFFFWEEENLERRSSYAPFPLDREALKAEGHTLLPGGARQQAPVAVIPPQVETPRVADAPKRAPRLATRRTVYAAVGALLIVTALLSAGLMHLANRPSQDESSVALNIQPDGGALRLNWNSSAPAVERANSGWLSISDGAKQRRLELDAAQLKKGTYLYTPESHDVNFRLDLLKVTTQGTESVRYVAEKESSAPPVAAGSRAPVAEPNSADRAIPVAHHAAEKNPRATVTARAVKPERNDEVPAPRWIKPPQPTASQQTVSQQPASQPAPQQVAKLTNPEPILPAPSAPSGSNAVQPPSEPLPQQQAPPPPQQATAKSPRPRPEPTVSVSTEPVPPPKYQEWVDKVPLVRTLQRNRYKGGDAFVLPRPIHEVTPRVPPRIARDLPGKWRVALKLNVDTYGRVREVELVSEADERLVKLAVDAIRQWRFEPARLHDRPVSSEMIVALHFRIPPADNVMAQRRD